MQYEISGRTAVDEAADALIVGGFAGGRLTAAARACDERLQGALREAYAAGFDGRAGSVRIFFTGGRLPARHVVLAGLGPQEEVGAEEVRRAAAAAVRAAEAAGARLVRADVFDVDLPGTAVAQAMTEAIGMALYRFDRYRAPGDEPRVETVGLHGEGRGLAAGVRRGRTLAEAVALARDLANEPGNALPPRAFAERLRQLAQVTGLSIEVWDEDRLAAEGCGAILAVGSGSAEPPRLVALRYTCGRKGAPLLALVGKGITFDAGGLSIKTAAGMETMRTDKSGAAAVAGAMRAIAELRPAVDVIGVVALAENVISGCAYRPGDVIRTLAGKTVEVANTDAEGRLVLADAVTYAARQGARWIVDIATLTGAAVVALGHEMGVIMASDEDLGGAVQAAGAAAGERFWPLPVDEAYRELIRSSYADIRNVAREREAGAIVGGMFIREFAGDTPWCHLDIAGAASGQKRPYHPESQDIANGFGTRTLALLAERLAAEAAEAEEAGG
ncbi:MAG: leucyl aminopeptidase [Firmicutes bacterium]|nr:leucyl aminopeptidase [Bacillota bacterium]